MKIAIVLPHNYIFCADKPNSIETVVRAINTDLIDKHNILVISGNGNRQGDNFPHYGISASSKKEYQNKVSKFLLANNFEFVEVHQLLGLASYIAKKTKIPTVLYKHNFIKVKNIVRKLLMNSEINHLSGIIFVSENSKDHFIKLFPNFTNKAFAIPNPINLDFWNVGNVKKENILFFAGREAPEKGLAELCDGLKLVLQEFPDWKAVLALGVFNTHAEWSNEQLGKLSQFSNRVEVLKDLPLALVKQNQARAKLQ